MLLDSTTALRLYMLHSVSTRDSFGVGVLIPSDWVCKVFGDFCKWSGLPGETDGELRFIFSSGEKSHEVLFKIDCRLGFNGVTCCKFA